MLYLWLEPKYPFTKVAKPATRTLIVGTKKVTRLEVTGFRFADNPSVFYLLMEGEVRLRLGGEYEKFSDIFIFPTYLLGFCLLDSGGRGRVSDEL